MVEVDDDVVVLGTPGAPGDLVARAVSPARGVRVDDRLALDLERLVVLARARPDVRFVHIVRHPFGVLASGPEQRDAEEAWVTSNGNLVDLADQLDPGRCLVVRCEDLEAGRTSRLVAFLGGRTVAPDDEFRRPLGPAGPSPAHRPGRAMRLLAAELGYDLDVAPAAAAGAGAPSGADMIRPAARGARVPATAAQRRLLFIESFEPGLAVHNLPSVKRVVGALDVTALEVALSTVVRRHEALRTDYEQVDGEWFQVVAPAAPMVVARDDLRDVPDDELAAVRDTAIAAEVRRPFDLAAGPKVRARLLQLADDEHLLVVTVHHIAADGTSMVRLTSEVAACYEAAVLGAEAAVPDLPVQYADVAVWQAEQAARGVLDDQLEHWRRRLAAPLPVLELPGDRPRPAVFSYAAGSVSVSFDADLVVRMRATARAAGVTPFMFLLASYVATLARWSGASDIVVGTATANRRAETEHLVGLFASTVPIRIDVPADATFAELLGGVKRETLGALANQDVPFDRVVQAVNPPRDLSRAPIFQTMFVLNNMTPASLHPVGGIVVEDVTVSTAAVDVDVSVVLDEAPDAVVGRVDFPVALFDESTIARFVGSWRALLAAAADDVALPIAELPVVPPGEVATMLTAWNDTARPVPAWSRVDAWCAAQAAATPDAPAARDATSSFTYAELDAAANRVARRLGALGVRRGDRVGVAVERSAAMVAVLLGVLKAGAAYVPLDPAFPAERLRFMVADAGLSHVVTSDAAAAASYVGAEQAAPPAVVDLVAEAAAIAAEDATAPPPVGDAPDAPAYVIYTSGSTGVPKGVVIGHRSVVNFLAAMQDRPGMAPGDVLVAVTTLSFDISVLELFLPLVSGATVVVASPDEVVDGNLLASLVERVGATVLQATPTTFAMLFESGWAGRRDLTVLCGGEAMSPTLADQLVTSCGPVWNMFGPTETTIWSTVAPISADAVAATTGGAMSIGTPIANTVCRVLDGRDALVPVGVGGELLIGGAGVAVGYLDRPELTAARFVADPFDPSGRLYRTGDLARWRPDGSLEFLGRIDQQVKLRGHRIELGDIEAALRDHPEVADAVVVVDGTGVAARLVGYVTTGGTGAVAGDELRSWARRRLPASMVPAAVVTLDDFPLTPNRKVDRRALQAQQVTIVPSAPSAPPATDVERVVARATATVLGVEGVGREDDFFDLGGHSLVATALLARLSSTFGTTLALRPFFAAPTVVGLAAQLLDDPDDRDRVERIARVEERLAAMSPDEISRLLAAKRGTSGTSGP